MGWFICPGGGMVDTLVLGTSGESRVGSSPTWGTKKILKKILRYGIFLYLCIVIEENDLDTQSQLHLGWHGNDLDTSVTLFL